MKVTIDMENLESIVEGTLKENSEKAIQQALHAVVEKKVNAALGSDVDNAVSSIVESYIREYLATAKIQVGNSWKGEEIKALTVEEYLKQQVSDIFESQVFYVNTKDRWGDKHTERITFQEFVERHFDVEKYAKKYLEQVAKDIRNEVDSKIKSIFNESMRNTLADTVFTIVSSSDTYQKVSNSLKLLGG